MHLRGLISTARTKQPVLVDRRCSCSLGGQRAGLGIRVGLGRTYQDSLLLSHPTILGGLLFLFLGHRISPRILRPSGEEADGVPSARDVFKWRLQRSISTNLLKELALFTFCGELFF